MPKNIDIAIIGMSGIFQKVGNNLDHLYEILVNKDELVMDLPDARREDFRIPLDTEVRQGGYLERIDLFDSAYFRLSKKEAIATDPQLRFLLECCVNLLRNAGYEEREVSGRNWGIYVSASKESYSDLLGSEFEHFAAGTLAGSLAGRLAHHLKTRGPAMAIDSACSSSLLAVVEAVQNLQHGCIDGAICGGFRTISKYFSSDSNPYGIFSPDGKTRPFSSSANGTGLGEGGGLFLLKRLDDAIADGDQIFAKIIASGSNQDAPHDGGFTAPSIDAQKDLLQTVWRNGQIDPSTIEVIEAHGTGTFLGDPIEVQAIHEALSSTGGGHCALHSIKGNIGHLDAAAGAAGLIAAVLMVQHGTIFGNVNLDEINRGCRFATLDILKASRPWTSGLRRAGVSSFGWIGTNVHLVIENYKQTQATRSPLEKQTFCKERLWPQVLEDVRIEARTPAIVEENLCENVFEKIWKDTLGIERVTSEDDFFHLGGDSLTFLSLANTIREEFGVILTFDDISLCSTFAKLEALIYDRKSGNGVITSLNRSQMRMLYLSQEQPTSSAYNIKLVYVLNDLIGIESLENAITALVKTNPILHSHIIYVESIAALSALETPFCIQIDQMPNEQAALDHAWTCVNQPLNLSENVAKVGITKTEHSQNVLWFSIHHLVIDDWGTKVLLRRFSEIYEQMRNGSSISSIEAIMQDQNKAVYKRDSHETDSEFWPTFLNGASNRLDLPWETLSSKRDGSAIVEMSLSEVETKRVKCFADENQTTLFEILFAAYALAIFRISGQENFIVGLPISGRDRLVNKDILGCFINTLPIPIRINAQDNYQDFLKSVSLNIRAALQQKETPLDEIVKSVSQSATGSSLIPTVFSLLNTKDSKAIVLDSIRHEAESLQSIESWFPISCAMWLNDKQLSGIMAYDNGRLSRHTVDYVVSRYHDSLKNIVMSDPQQINPTHKGPKINEDEYCYFEN